jgi:hypothetical protein
LPFTCSSARFSPTGKALSRARMSYQLVPLPRCNLCGAASSERLFSVSDAAIPVTAVICRACGLVYLNETLPEDAAHTFYRNDDWRAIVYGQDLDDTFLEHLFRDQVRRAGCAPGPLLPRERALVDRRLPRAPRHLSHQSRGAYRLASAAGGWRCAEGQRELATGPLPGG